MQKYFRILEANLNTTQPFQFEVEKNDTSTYLIKILFQSPNLDNQTLDLELAHLNGSLFVPQKVIPIQVPEDHEETEIHKDNEDAIFAVQISLDVIIGGSIIGTIALSASSTVWAVISTQQFIGYFIYVNVLYPRKVEVFLLILQTSLWDSLPNPLSSITDSLLRSFLTNQHGLSPEYQPPLRFRMYDQTSFFIENGGGLIFTNLTLLIVLMITMLLKNMQRFQNRIFLKKIKVYLRWNGINRIFLENGIPLALAIFLQIRILSFNSAYLSISSLFTIISLGYMIAMIIFISRILFKRENDLLKKDLIKRIFGTLHEGIELNHSLSKYFHIIILFRGILLVFLVVFFEDYPLLQILPLIFFQIGLIYYMIKEVPFEDKKFNTITKIKEGLILLGEIGVIFLMFKSDNKEYYEIIGWVILIPFGIGFIIELGYVIILQIVEIKAIINQFVKLWRKFEIYLKSFCPPNKKKKLKLAEIRIPRDESNLMQISEANITAQ